MRIFILNIFKIAIIFPFGGYEMVQNKFYRFIIEKSSGRFIREQEIANKRNSIKASIDSPKRIEMMLQKGVTENESNRKILMSGILHNFPNFIMSFKGVNKSIVTLEQNPLLPKRRATEAFIKDFEQYAFSLGINAIGYTIIQPRYIFKDKAVLYRNVIVLTKEMNKSILVKGPNNKSFNLVWQTYDSIGKVANILTKYLRKQGYGAQSGPAMSGLSIYPLLGEKAGLGAIGKHGLLISPKYGSMQRIAVIYTSLDYNPPVYNPHLWIKKFCNSCNKCVRNCPSQAIYQQSLKQSNGLETSIDSDKCLESFINNHGCSICIIDCPFSLTDYNRLKTVFFRKS